LEGVVEKEVTTDKLTRKQISG